MEHKYYITSDCKVIEYPVFEKQGKRKNNVYQRNNSAENGFVMNDRTRSKIRRYMASFLHYEQIKDKRKNLMFITLTVPTLLYNQEYQPKEHDLFVTNQLKKYLENLRKNHDLSKYVWVAERQDGKRNEYTEKTNAIHYHILMEFNKFVSITYLNNYWLNLLSDVGFNVYTKDISKINAFIDKQKEHEKQGLLSLIESQVLPNRFLYANKDDLCNTILAKPVQMEKVTDIKGLAKYFSKYITKGTEDNKIYSRIWAASKGIAKYKTLFSISKEQYQLLINTIPNKVYESELFTSTSNLELVYKCKSHFFKSDDFDKVQNIFREMLKKHFSSEKRKKRIIFHLKHKQHEFFRTDDRAKNLLSIAKDYRLTRENINGERSNLYFFPEQRVESHQDSRNWNYYFGCRK